MKVLVGLFAIMLLVIPSDRAVAEEGSCKQFLKAQEETGSTLPLTFFVLGYQTGMAMAQKRLEASKMLIDAQIDMQSDVECSSCYGAFAVKLDKAVSTLGKHGDDMLVALAIAQCEKPENESRGWAGVVVETLIGMEDIKPTRSK